MSFLRDLQSKSQAVKANYAFAFASAITGLIVIVWMSSIPARFSDMKGNEEVEKKDGEEGVQAQAEFLDTAKSQLGNLVNWNKTETSPTTEEEVPTDYAPNMMNLNLEAGDTVYAEDPAEVVPIEQKEKILVPEPDLQRIPGITMPTDIKPQATPETVSEKMPEPTPPAPTTESGGKKALIEISTTPPKPIMIETKPAPQEVPQN